MAALALILMHSLHIWEILRASPTPIVMRMCDCSSGLAYVRYYPYPAEMPSYFS